MAWPDLGTFAFELEVMTRLILATLLGAAIGWERERRQRPAGLRTFTLVCVGSTLFTLASLYGFVDPDGLPVDRSRVAAQIVTGIGFLGAGTIVRGEAGVRGVTTAGGIWLVAAVGMLAGLGMYFVAVFATVLALLVLAVFRRLEASNH